MTVWVGPHEWEPNRFRDRFRRRGECWWCILPRHRHPVRTDALARGSRPASGRGARRFRGAGRG